MVFTNFKKGFHLGCIFKKYFSQQLFGERFYKKYSQHENKSVLSKSETGICSLLTDFCGVCEVSFSEYIFSTTLIVLSFLGHKMYKFYHVLPARCNDSKEFQKLSLNIF